MSIGNVKEVMQHIKALEQRITCLEEEVHSNIHQSNENELVKRTYTSESKKKIQSTQIHSYKLRQERKVEKQNLILDFLLRHTWTIPDIVRILINVKSIQAATKTLERMKKDGLIKDFEYKNGTSRLHRVWGITRQGQVYASNINESAKVGKCFEPSKVSIQSIPHALDIQYMYLTAINAGYSDWVNGSALGYKKKLMRIPDAISVSNNNIRVAFEIERTVKSTKRYREILLSHLIEITKNDSWDLVAYLCPDEKLVTRITNIFRRIEHVNYQGKKIYITNQHLSYFKFFTYEEFRNMKRNVDEKKYCVRTDVGFELDTA